jgi:hypothetical protein
VIVTCLAGVAYVFLMVFIAATRTD